MCKAECTKEKRIKELQETIATLNKALTNCSEGNAKLLVENLELKDKLNNFISVMEDVAFITKKLLYDNT